MTAGNVAEARAPGAGATGYFTGCGASGSFRFIMFPKKRTITLKKPGGGALGDCAR